MTDFNEINSRSNPILPANPDPLANQAEAETTLNSAPPISVNNRLDSILQANPITDAWQSGVNTVVTNIKQEAVEEPKAAKIQSYYDKMQKNFDEWYKSLRNKSDE